jgi:hypothetical protein
MLIFVERTPQSSINDLMKIERGLSVIAAELSKISMGFILNGIGEALNFRPGSKADKAKGQLVKIQTFATKLQTTVKKYKFSYPELFDRYAGQIKICQTDIIAIQGSLNEIWERGKVTSGTSEDGRDNISIVKQHLISCMNEINRVIDILQRRIDVFNNENAPLRLDSLSKIVPPKN